MEEFLAHRRAEGYVLWLSTKALVPMVGYLRGIGVVPTPPPAVAVGEAERLQEHYRAYLVEERGLAAGTIAGYVHVARRFLAARAADGGELRLDELGAAEVTEFVLAECASRSVGSAKYIVCGLRSLLRYLYVAGHIETELDAAVPTAAGWRLATVPVTVGRAEVARLLASCDRRTTFGRRDYAVLTVLARLGLRAGEVAALELADIDWRAGEIVVRGKGRRAERLPLPADVGEALAGWLRRGRPRCDATTVFTRVRAPHRALTSGGVSGDRAGCVCPCRPAAGARPSPPSHGGDRDAARRRVAARGGPSAASRQRVDHRYLRQGRPRPAAQHRPSLAGSGVMSTVRVELDRYLAIRRALGFKLARAELLLADYLRYLEEMGADTITTDNAVRGPPCRPTVARAGGANGSRWCGPSPATCTPSTRSTRCRPPGCCRPAAIGRCPTCIPTPRSPRS
ncbi:MAG TPA: tyrosine-type recombinase/integrase [Acidimicrobiales bacterium]|nr:tyrosine-type recombinase/integrase [Acidimicrobiales bacterium]